MDQTLADRRTDTARRWLQGEIDAGRLSQSIDDDVLVAIAGIVMRGTVRTGRKVIERKAATPHAREEGTNHHARQPRG